MRLFLWRDGARRHRNIINRPRGISAVGKHISSIFPLAFFYSFGILSLVRGLASSLAYVGTHMAIDKVHAVSICNNEQRVFVIMVFKWGNGHWVSTDLYPLGAIDPVYNHT